MQLMWRGVVGTGCHRSGWPRVMDALRKVVSDPLILLDDFTDASFSYTPLKAPHSRPWVGVFHHATEIHSPLAGDRKQLLRKIENHRFWRESVKHLRGAVALCEDVATDLRDWLGVPVLNVLHPTETGVLPWNAAAMADKLLVQAGYCQRNTQVIFQVDVPGWQRIKLFGASPSYKSRDEHLRNNPRRPDIDRSRVSILRRLPDAGYDALLATSVLLVEMYGAAANNLTVEAMVRGTPMLVNRLPAVAEYLGDDYPLFWGELSDVPGLLADEGRIRAASAQLLDRSKLLPSFEEFAVKIRDFVDSLA